MKSFFEAALPLLLFDIIYGNFESIAGIKIVVNWISGSHHKRFDSSQGAPDLKGKLFYFFSVLKLLIPSYPIKKL